MKKTFYFLLLFILNCSICFSQSKLESEKRIKEKLVNPKAKILIRNSFPNSKYKWFLEVNESGEFYECKFKAAEYYSVKFTLDGQIVDVELEKDIDYLPKKVIQKISSTLEQDSLIDNNYKINKIQEQWTGSQNLLQSALRENQFIPGLKILIEIEIAIKHKGEIVFEEWLLSLDGDLIRRREIIKPKLDNLIY